jgi:ADP-ribose pyrophosphatase YjhB (NUDIX family)
MIQYNNPTPVAVALLPVYRVGTRGLIAVRRGIEPQIGGIALPGGYVDEMETAEMAVSREVMEEVGILIPTNEWRPVATGITPQNRLIIFLITNRLVDSDLITDFIPNREVLELLVVDKTSTLAFDTHQTILLSNLW